MQTSTRFRFVLTSLFVAVFLLVAGNSFAQQQKQDEPVGKKTITVHIVKEMDGTTTTIDTVIVTDGEFDADVFFDENDLKTDKPEGSRKMKKEIIIRNPDSGNFSWTDADGSITDSLIMDENRMMVFRDDRDDDMHTKWSSKPGSHYKFNSTSGLRGMNSDNIEMIIEGMARSIGLGNVMPFGDMKKMVVKKKRNGKKVIITFEDRNDDDYVHRHGNRKEENIIIIKNEGDNPEPVIEKRIIMKGDGGEKVIIQKDTDEATPVKKQKEVIIIKEEKTK